MKRSEHTHCLLEKHHCELFPDEVGGLDCRGPRLMRAEVNASQQEEKPACSLSACLSSRLVRSKSLNIRKNLDLVIQFGKSLDKRYWSLCLLYAQRLGTVTGFVIEVILCARFRLQYLILTQKQFKCCCEVNSWM